MNELDLYYALILDKKLDDPNCKSDPDLIKAMQYFNNKAQENMGIELMNYAYVFVKDGQDVREEYSKIENMLARYIAKLSQESGNSCKNYDIEFINYGRTELVYVLTDKFSNTKTTILAKQPCVEFGKVKTEMQNLVSLSKIDTKVVAPTDYFAYGDGELFATPYLNQARCIASDKKWGMYIPEPNYHFEPFTREQEQVVNQCMIAKLVSLYNFDKQQGIASCKLGGGDFILSKGWEKLEHPTIEYTMENMYLIALRDMVNCPFDDYLDILRDEFSRKTINEDQDNLIVNHRGRAPMEAKDIESGIDLGIQLLKEREVDFKEQDCMCE